MQEFPASNDLIGVDIGGGVCIKMRSYACAADEMQIVAGMHNVTAALQFVLDRGFNLQMLGEKRAWRSSGEKGIHLFKAGKYKYEYEVNDKGRVRKRSAEDCSAEE